MTAARILVVDDEADIRSLIKEILAEEGYEVEVAANGQEARSLRRHQAPDLILLDIWMPDVDGITLLREWSAAATEECPVVMMSGHGTVETAVEATRLGAVDFIEKPLSIAKLLRTVERGLEGQRHRRVAGKWNSAAMMPVGKSKALQQLRAELARLAATELTVMLIGEPGSGREAFARFLHAQSARAAAPFVVLVASALREGDFEATLFGRVDGTAGILEDAADGTLYISELGDLPSAAQRALAGVLETGAVARLGDTQSPPFRARVVSAAMPAVAHSAGSAPEGLRRDLFEHLSGATVRVPALREYAEDVPELLRHCVDRSVDEQGLAFRRFGVAAQNRLRNYPWPGNVQEMRVMVRRLLQQGGDEEISLEEIEHELAQTAAPAGTAFKQDLLALSLREAREHFERVYLQQQLLLCQGKVGQLAKRVGMERTHLYRKLRALGVDFRSGVDEDESISPRP